MITKKLTKTKTKQKILKYAIMIVTLSLMVGCVFCTDIFAVGGDLSKDLFTKIRDLYCNGLFFLLAVIDIVLWAFYSKDEKLGKIFKGALITLVIAYFALHLIGTIKNTIDDMVGKYDTSSDTSIEYTGGDTGNTTGE